MKIDPQRTPIYHGSARENTPDLINTFVNTWLRGKGTTDNPVYRETFSELWVRFRGVAPVGYPHPIYWTLSVDEALRLLDWMVCWFEKAGHEIPEEVRDLIEAGLSRLVVDGVSAKLPDSLAAHMLLMAARQAS